MLDTLRDLIDRARLATMASDVCETAAIGKELGWDQCRSSSSLGQLTAHGGMGGSPCSPGIPESSPEMPAWAIAGVKKQARARRDLEKRSITDSLEKPLTQPVSKS